MAKIIPVVLRAIRSGIVDVWNAFMVAGASFDVHDIPCCPTTAERLPHSLISWPEAKRLYKSEIKRGNKDFHCDAFIHFYVDDCKFDGVRSSIWLFPQRALKVMSHFGGIVTPDFSMCQDFPEPIKLFAVYRMRAFGYWAGQNGIEVINNVRWGTRETWGYCFAGIRRHTVVAVGSVASGLRSLCNRDLFEEGLIAMAEALDPAIVIVYGSANYVPFDLLRERGVRVIQFDSDTAKAFSKEAKKSE